jgi:ABC-type branched-subunit amino acid transport system substrate-binding protein
MRSALTIFVAFFLFCASFAAIGETGVTNDTIVIGQSAALTGPAAELGIEMRRGAQMYFDVINQNGGIHGRKITLISLDDGYEPPRAEANTKQLIEKDKVFALFGYVGTPTSAASIPISTEAKVPFFGAFTGAQLLREPFNKYIFNVRASYFDETEEIVDYLVKIGVKKIAVFYQNDSYGKAGLAGVEKAMKKRNLQIAASGTVERNTVNVVRAVDDITKVAPEAVVMISAYKSCAAFIREARKAGNKAQFFNVSFVGSKALATELGKQGRGVVISQVVPFPWDKKADISREYRNMMAKNKFDSLSFTSLEGYIAAKIFVEGLKRSGKDLTRTKFISSLEQINDFDMGGFKVNFSAENHNASKYVDLTIIGKDDMFFH